ncbi:mechanosensitive ion channel family protein [Granulicella mallensis]|uniref:Small-conductance mechanosensitive channel n=1 Tax=Granulicella mallensis TaxID=940614 RepID=A0A7W8EBX4_9BACT|nr:mechanosensitive ion channel family protein [Granulicella mallensis]MBB5066302.1 small-conductance mechanosensitive channel [Granulicella mallensis]
MTHALHFQHDWFFAIFLFCTALVLANVIHFVLFRLLRRKEAENTHLGWGLQRHLGAPSRAVFFITCLLIVLPVIPRLSGKLQELLNQIFIMALIAALGWFAVGCVYVLQNVFLRRYDLTAENNVQARRIHTQFQLFRRMVISLVIVIDVGALLWSFHDPRIWHYGTGLLASAGVASLILATAAKSTAANFLAGLQIAITEPIRIDDVVVVQGEWGRIEEITSAYVVIKIWDLRRLIVPLSYFIENSFQNWSREQSDIMGTAFLYVDYSIPVEELRGELNRIIQASALWDKKVCGLQVTNLSERTMELRCLVSSHNSSQNFDLRCLVREQMTAFIQRNYPEAFPTTRFSAHATSPGDPPEAGHID